MKKSFLIYSSILILLVFISYFSQNERVFSKSDDVTKVAADCDSSVVYFKQDVLPLLQSNCAKSGCHNEETRKHSVVLNSYENLMATVEMESEDDDFDDDRNDDRDRDDYRRGRGNGTDRYKNKLEKMIMRNKMPPSPEKKLSQEQRNIILKWIDQGMQNNSCEVSASDCNSVNMNFTNDIKPIIEENCVGCHGGAKPKKGYDFSNPDKFREVALTGLVYLAVSHSEGATPMPFEGDKLSDCDISKIKSWIDAGAELK
jgi:hypothetical protein